MKLRPAARVSDLERTLIRRIFDGAPAGAINLGLGQPDLPTPATPSLAGIAAIVQGRTGYTSTAGDPELRAAVAAHYGFTSGAGCDVLITVGSQEALYVGCMTLVDPGAEVLHPDPGYPAYPVVARLLGAVPVAYPLRAADAFRLRAAEVEARLGERTALVILSAPSNPTGACHPPDELERLTRELARRGIPWLSDEVYAGFTYGGPNASPLQFEPEGGIVVSGLSKDTSMTGWRIGWLAGPTAIVERAIAAHQYVVTCASSVSQRAAVAAFGAEGRAERAAYFDRFKVRREVMAAELGKIPGLRFDLPEGAFYFFVDVGLYGTGRSIASRILERRSVITIPGEAFGTQAPGHLRLSFAATESDIRRGIGLIAEELAVMARER